MARRGGVRGWLLAGVLGLCIGPVQAASAFDVDALAWFKGGSLVDWTGPNASDYLAFFDDFDDGLAPPSSSWIYPSGYPASYTFANVTGSVAGAVSESGGFLHLDPSQSTPLTDASGNNAAHTMGVRLVTNLNEAEPSRGFNRASPNGVAAVFALPDFAAGEAIGLRLSDGFSNINNVVDLRVGGGVNGSSIYWREQDFASGTVTMLDSTPFVVPAGADRLVLGLSKAGANDDLVEAYYGFLDSASGQFVSGGELTALAGSTRIFDGESFSRIELRAVSPVPEPHVSLMLFVGLGVVLARSRRQKPALGG